MPLPAPKVYFFLGRRRVGVTPNPTLRPNSLATSLLPQLTRRVGAPSQAHAVPTHARAHSPRLGEEPLPKAHSPRLLITPG
jgi:hypothetical protein